MIPINRDTAMLIATIVCAVGIIFLFKELNKTKEEMNTFKSFSAQVIRHLSAPEPVAAPAPAPAPVPTPTPVVEKKEDEKSEE
jgi:hypothetical protein